MEQITPTTHAHTATVIFVHGLGGKNHRWCSRIKNKLSETKQLPHVKFVFPLAPSVPVSFMNGENVPSWYDIYARPEYTDSNSYVRNPLDINTNDLLHTIKYIGDLVEQESKFVPLNRIVIAGISQGATVCISSLLYKNTNPVFSKLASVCSFCGWMGLPDELITSDAVIPPLFIYQGAIDQLVSIGDARTFLHKTLKLGATNVHFVIYPDVGHAISDEGLEYWFAFLEKLIPPSISKL